MTMLYDKKITEKSYREMLKFVSFANKIGETPLVFGGWAVYHYNPYAGSKDVDFVVSDEHFDECVDFLVKKEGYELREARLFRQDIFFDLYKRSEGITTKTGSLDFSLLYADAEKLYLKGTQLEFLVPSIRSLFLFKVKALAERQVPKDQSDVIALLIKFTEEDFTIKNNLDDRMRQKLETLINKVDVFSLVVKPTKKNISEISNRIKRLVK